MPQHCVTLIVTCPSAGFQTANNSTRFSSCEQILRASSQGSCCSSSRGMAGTLTAKYLDQKLDINGSSFKDAATAAGYGGSSHKVRLQPVAAAW